MSQNNTPLNKPLLTTMDSLSSANRFERIYLSTYFPLEKFVQHFIRNSDTALDILQDTYMQLWEHIEEIRDDEKTLSLLRTYATHRMINELRRAAKARQHAEIFHAWQQQTTTADHELHFKETMADYRQVLAELPDQQRTVYQLSEEEGLSYREIAAKLQSTPRAIKYHLAEARKQIRSRFTMDQLALALLLVEMQRILG